MTKVKILPLKKTVTNFLLIITFIFFLYPYSFLDKSANYFFVLFPVLITLLTGKIKKPTENIVIIVLFFFLIFFIATFYQYELIQYLDRRLTSFIIFMTLFSYLIIDIDTKQINAFKAAVVLIIIYFTISNIIKFYIYTLEGQVNFKYFLGSSRYGFVYLLAFWITLLHKPSNKLFNALKYLTILLILIGIFLTYSRTTILAFFLTLVLYFLSNFSSIKKNFFVKLNFFTIIAATFFSILILIKIFFSKYIFFNFQDTVFTYIYNDGVNLFLERLSNPLTSEGFRLHMIGKILHYVSLSPIFGSGFLGCWIMYDNMGCSAHNQYTDVLFRVGFIGFFFYILILFQIFKYLKNQHRDFFYGFISIIIYGFFHETFKLSQGGFILTFLLGMTYTSKRGNLLN